MAEPAFLCVDPSMSKTGLALVNPSKGLKHGFLIAHSTVGIPQRAGDVPRLAYLARDLRETIRMFSPERLIVETPTSLYVKPGRSLNALKVLLAIGVTVGVAVSCGLEVHPLPVADWKGRKSGDKEASRQLAEHLWPDEKFSSDDECEACLMGVGALMPDAMFGAMHLLHIGVPVQKAASPLHSPVFQHRDLKRLIELTETTRIGASLKGKRRRP